MDKIGEFFLTLLHAATNTHILHLQTTSYAEHVALQGFYQELPELVDTVIESIQGRYGQIIQYPADYFVPSNTPLEELEALQVFVSQNRQYLPQDSEIQNDVDQIASLINSTLYKLRFLK
jgi:hypothetical protein